MVPLFLATTTSLLLTFPLRQNFDRRDSYLALYAKKRNTHSGSASLSDLFFDNSQNSKEGNPPSPKRINLSLCRTPATERDRTSSCDFIPISVYQIEDNQWWREKESQHYNQLHHKDNPYGARCWPSSVAVADYLIQTVLPSLQEDAEVVELGCGPGIPSLAAATTSLFDRTGKGDGEHQIFVTATDVSPTALTLLSKGWKATRKRHEKQLTKKLQADSEVSLSTRSDHDALSIRSFDICSSDPLPFVSTGKSNPRTRRILVACTMLYDPTLAAALARRVEEAVHQFDAWVILGDDVTGERGSGRDIFLKALQEKAPQLASTTTTATVQIKNAALGWQAKETKVWEWGNVRCINVNMCD
ncbi:lysine methyltransferase [Nitzschia inconspicua]|uniref:Lysine methyltransferase n=1 Tax=Nitzschia inconspicua TaxID=303405 RepID=A0A9K3KJ21_9STRA|nr:lysine methyltransferase [Nitzschia inconspicua]